MSVIYLEENHPAAQRLLDNGIQVEKSEAVFGAPPLRIGVINLMPKPVDPIGDFGTLFAGQNAPDIEIIDFGPSAELYTSTPEKQRLRAHLNSLFILQDRNLDGVILTGFGKEEISFEEIDFWHEVVPVLDHVKERKIPMLASCWGSHAALHHYHGIQKDCDMTDKISGAFAQKVTAPHHPLMKGLDGHVTMPVSRYGRSSDDGIESNPNLIVLAKSPETGTAIVTDTQGDVLYLTGHPEYNKHSLPEEYFRDLEAGTPHLRVPENIFQNDVASRSNILPSSWEGTAKVLGQNWLKAVSERKQSRYQERVVAPGSGNLALSA
ncbi:MAG: homoserine O-succinyltransferase [Pseudomonadota bacterium]